MWGVRVEVDLHVENGVRCVLLKDTINEER